MASAALNASLRSPCAPVVKYDVLAAVSCAGLARTGISKDLAHRLTLLILARFNWNTGEISCGNQQLADMWAVDLRRVKRIMAELKELGVIHVARLGCRGRVTSYRLSLDAIARLTRAAWHRLGADIVARLDAMFPDHTENAETDSIAHTNTNQEEQSNVVPLKSFKKLSPPSDPIKLELARHLSSVVMDRWINDLTFEMKDRVFYIRSQSKFRLHYVEQKYDALIRSVVKDHKGLINTLRYTDCEREP